MALKAYKHLTDGEVKLVEADSAEEAGLVADVVHGASYIQLQNDGTREEVEAAQGDALWEDVSDELGGGGSAFAHLIEEESEPSVMSDREIISVLDYDDPLGSSYAYIAPDGSIKGHTATGAQFDFHGDGSGVDVRGTGGVLGVGLFTDGALDITSALGTLTLRVDADNDLTVNNVKVQLAA